MNRRLRGHYAYYNVSDNWMGVMEFRKRTEVALLWALNRRGQQRSFSWTRFHAYVARHGLLQPGRVASLNPAPAV